MYFMKQCASVVIIAGFIGASSAELILNEANCIGPNGRWIDNDTAKPYEGFDFGIVPHSLNTNSPIAPVDPGNPFGAVNANDPNQAELPNGWTKETGFARILENGGDWIELVVTEDFTDLRGYTLYWENDDNENGIVGDDDDERGIITFTQNPIWDGLRAGTIITISEDELFPETRDAYPLGPPDTGVHSTGFSYDLQTDLSYDPVGIATQHDPISYFDARDWHIHLWLDESVTVGNENTPADDADTAYFKAGSDLRVDNDDWRMSIYDNSNSNPVNDKVTGLVQSAVGESASLWGLFTGAGGVNSQELLALVNDPESERSNGYYEDVDFSTFGRANLFNQSTEATLDGVQDFSSLWAWVPILADGDSDFDNDVDLDDLQRHLENYSGPGNADDIPWSRCAIDGDGDIDVADTALLQAAFGD